MAAVQQVKVFKTVLNDYPQQVLNIFAFIVT